MNNRLLGIVAMVGAPFLLLDSLININFQAGKIIYTHSSLAGVFDLIYITAWICSIVGLHKIRAGGDHLIGKAILNIQLLLLCLANIWNVYEIVSPGSSSAAYIFLDSFWPISNIFMLVTGTAIALAGKLKSFKRFVPLLVGFWFPLNVLPSMVLGLDQSLLIIVIGGSYSAVTWLMLGRTVYITNPYAQ